MLGFPASVYTIRGETCKSFLSEEGDAIERYTVKDMRKPGLLGRNSLALHEVESCLSYHTLRVKHDTVVTLN